MGFLKKIFVSGIVILMVSSCGKSLIEIAAKIDYDPYPMFGRISSRNFYEPVTVSDSLKLKWEAETYGSFTNSSVTTYDDYVFTSDLGGRIFVFNITDGKRVGMLRSKNTIYSAPIITKSFVIYAMAEEKSDMSELIYYDYKEGDEVYNKEINNRILSEMIGLDDGIIFLTESGRITKYNLSGNSIWETETGSTTRCSPSLSENRVIFGNDDGEVILIDAANGRLVDRKKIEGIFTGVPTIDSGIAYLSNNNGMIYAIGMNDIKVRWKYNTGARILMSPAVDNENVVIGNLGGYLFSLNKNNGNLNWQKEFSGLFNATPLLTENRIIISDLDRSFFIVDKNDGNIKNVYSLEGRVKLSPVYFKNILFIGYDRGILRAYEFVY